MYQDFDVRDKVIVGVGDLEIIDGYRTRPQADIVDRQIAAIERLKHVTDLQVLGHDPAGTNNPEGMFGRRLDDLAANLDDYQPIHLTDKGPGHFADEHLAGIGIIRPDGISGLDLLLSSILKEQSM